MDISKLAAELGRLGGKAKSKAKTAAARENGKKGGWPKGRKRMQTFRVIENGETLDVKAKSLETMVHARYGKTAQVHVGDGPHYTITRTDRYGRHIVAQVVKE